MASGSAPGIVIVLTVPKQREERDRKMDTSRRGGQQSVAGMVKTFVFVEQALNNSRYFTK